MGVCDLGVEISKQVVLIPYYFGIKECDKLQKPLGGKLDGRIYLI